MRWPALSPSSRAPHAGIPKLRAGASVTIDALGEPFDGKYTITTSRHRFDPLTGYTTAFSVTGRRDRTLLGLASSGRGKAPPGIVIGQVSDAADPEKAGRVKLTFPWLSADYVSDWARSVQAGAGKDRGWQVVPEVGDEVLVAFEQGDYRQPMVIGGLFNGVDTMPRGPVDLVDGGTGRINRRSMVSRLGHRVDLVDASGKEGVRVSTTGREAQVDHGSQRNHDHAARRWQGRDRRNARCHDRFGQREHGAQGQSDHDQGPGWGHRRRWKFRGRESGQPAQPDRRHREARRQWHHRREGGCVVLHPSSNGQDQLSSLGLQSRRKRASVG